MKKLFLLPLLAVCFYYSYSQEYRKAFGLRTGATRALTYKVFTEPEKAFEGQLSFRQKGIQFTLMLVTQRPAMEEYSDRISAYYGMGAHVGYIKRGKEKDFFGWRPFSLFESAPTNPVIGIDGIAGLEYAFLKAPFTIGIEGRPMIELFGQPLIRIHFISPGITFRYIINHQQ